MKSQAVVSFLLLLGCLCEHGHSVSIPIDKAVSFKKEIQLSPSSSEPMFVGPGFKSTLTQNGLQYFCQVGTALLEKELKFMQIPIQNGVACMVWFGLL